MIQSLFATAPFARLRDTKTLLHSGLEAKTYRIRFIGLHILCSVIASVAPADGLAHVNPPSNTGEIEGYHGHTATCALCHIPAGTPYNGTIAFGGSSTVTHGRTLTGLTVGLNAGSVAPSGIGFNAAIYSPSDAGPLTGLSTGDSNARTSTSGLELTHTSPQAPSYNWTFQWQAPETLGTYTLYACVNQVDHAPSAATHDSSNDNPACGTRTITVTNTAPNAYDRTVTVDEDHSITFNPCTGTGGSISPTTNVSPDADGDTVAFVSSSGLSGSGDLTHSGCSFTFNASGAFDNLAVGETDSTASFTYTVTDGIANDTGTVTIDVTGVNDPPVGTDDNLTVEQGQPAGALNGGANTVLANDSDAEQSNTTLTVELVTGPAHATGTFNLNTSDGTYSYTHDASSVDTDPATVDDSFTYRVVDNQGDKSGDTTVNIFVNANSAPMAVNDTATVAEGGGVTIKVLDNDSDVNGDLPLVIDPVAGSLQALHGNVVVNSDQTVTYTNNGDESSSDSFTY
jgi:hypothetical protein